MDKQSWTDFSELPIAKDLVVDRLDKAKLMLMHEAEVILRFICLKQYASHC
jgi:hypothetical protein